jgi:hypothetical protein
LNQDDRPVYDDRNYFLKGRSGFRPDPNPQVNRTDVILSVLALLAIGIVFGLCVWLR